MTVRVTATCRPRRRPRRGGEAAERDARGRLRGRRAEPTCCAASRRRRASRGPPSASCPRRRSSCRPAGRARSTTRARSLLELRRRADASTRSTCRSSPARCARRARRWARCSSARAHSANIKERRDCSTALFDADGEMVMQAEHIPVHLGAMPAAVAAVLGEDHARRRARGSSTTPTAGGTHLPDITVVTPSSTTGTLLGFAASRAHHADVGGRVPGSMPADSHDARGGGRRDRAPRARRRGDRRARPRRCASPPSAAPTCARSSPPTAPARGAWRELAGARRRRRAARGVRRGPRLRRAPHARLPARAAPTATREATRRARGAPTATSSCG